MRSPSFLFIGPDKSGSTWLYRLLIYHPQAFMSPAKELFYFDRYYEKGEQWYLKHFSGATDKHLIVGEVSHDYLFSQVACGRIKRDLPDVKLMVCLREPVDRAFSSYLYMLRQGRVRGTFEDALSGMHELIDHGLYAKHLEPYLRTFGRQRIHVSLFDDLKDDPQGFAKAVFEFLGLKLIELPDPILGPSLPASAPRSVLGASLAKRVAMLVRRAGWPTVVTRIKDIPAIQSILFRPYDNEAKPKMEVSTRRWLKDHFRGDVSILQSLVGIDVVRRWGYDERVTQDDTALGT